MLAASATVGDDDARAGLPSLCPLPALELCVAQPASVEVWHLQVADTPSLHSLTLLCVSGRAASAALMTTPLPLSTLRQWCAPMPNGEPIESRCDSAHCPLVRGAWLDTVLSGTQTGLPFLYSYQTGAHSHEAGALVAALAMGTLRRHLLLLLGSVELREAGVGEQAVVSSPPPLSGAVAWCDDRVASAVRACCERFRVGHHGHGGSRGGDAADVAPCYVRVRWTPMLVMALAESWTRHRAALESGVTTPAALASALPTACWLRSVRTQATASQTAPPVVHTRSTTPPTGPTVSADGPAHAVVTPAAAAEEEEEDSVEAWSEDDDGSISDLETASATGVPHDARDEEVEREEALAALSRPRQEHVASRVSWTCVCAAGPCLSLTVSDVPPQSTLRAAQATCRRDDHTRHAMWWPTASTTVPSRPDRAGGGRLVLQCTQLDWRAASADDVWLAAQVTRHLLEHVLLPADRQREDGNDLLREADAGASAEAATVYRAGALRVQKGLAYPYTTPLYAAREAGSYTTAEGQTTGADEALARWMASRDAVYRCAASAPASALFAEQRVWKPMASADAAGVFARVLLRVAPLPSTAAIDPALAYASPAAAARSEVALPPCVAPAWAAMHWRRAPRAALPAVTRLQLVWYTLQRMAVVLAANTAEATLRTLAASAGPPSAAVTMGELQSRAQACEKAGVLLWGLLHWHQPAGPPPRSFAAHDGNDDDDTREEGDGDDAWDPTRSAEAQKELLWCFQMFAKLKLRAARLWKCVEDDARQASAVRQLREAQRLWTTVRRRRELPTATTAATTSSSSTCASPRWKDVPMNTPESLVCELSDEQWSALAADVAQSLKQM